MSFKYAGLLSLGLLTGCSSYDASKNFALFGRITPVRFLSSSIVVNRNDNHVSIDEVLAEANTFDKEDATAKKIYAYILPQLVDVRSVMSSSTYILDDANGLMKFNWRYRHDYIDTVVHDTVRWLEFLPPPDSKHPFAVFLSSLLKKLCYVSVDEYNPAKDNERFKLVHHFPFSGEMTVEKIVEGKDIYEPK